MRNPLLDEAWSAQERGDRSLAEKLYRDCLAENSDNSSNAEALRELALIEYGFKKNTLKAKELIEHSLSQEDNIMAHFYRGLILDNLRVYPHEAEKELEYSIRKSGGDAMMNSMYGNILMDQGNLEKAKLHFIAALSKEPDYEPAQESYAKLLKMLKPTHE